MIVVQTGPDEFLIGGSAVSITVAADPDEKEGTGGIVSVEEGSRTRGEWSTKRRLNGDQNDQGRTILMDRQFQLFRVKLYTIPR